MPFASAGPTVTSSAQIAPGIIVDSDVAAGAAIAYSKLNLALGIVNADISNAAAIAVSKLAAGTQGGIMYRTTAGAMAELAAGTAGQVLKTNGPGADPSWVTSSSSRLDVAYTAAAFTTSTAENTLYSGTIAANKLGTANAVRFRFYISTIHQFNTESFTLRFKLGGTTIHTFTYGGTNTISEAGVIEVVVAAQGATNSQKVVMLTQIAEPSYIGNGSLKAQYFANYFTAATALDSTAGIAVALTSQLSTSGGGEGVTCDLVTAEVIS
jgi:hypothetical protein